MVAPRRFALIGHTHNLSDLVGDSDDIDEGTTNLFFTDERAQDAVGSILVDTASIDFTYSDSTPSVSAVVLPAGVNHNALANLTVGDPHTQYELEANLTEDVQDIVGAFLVDSTTIDFTYNDAGNSITTAVIPGGVDHNALLNFVANKHIDHTAVTLTAGAGLTGTGDISASRTFAVGAGTGITVNADDVALDTSSTRNTDHAGVTLTAGAGLTGGGDISASRTFDIGAGTGITVNANDVQIATTYQGANPSATIGLTAVNGTATTTMRSDGAPALSQAIVPTWSGVHTFQAQLKSTVSAGGSSAGVQLEAANPGLGFRGTGGGTDEKQWDIIGLSNLNLGIRAVNDANSGASIAMLFSRSGATPTTVQLPLDNLKFQLGASQDLSIYHDGTDNIISSVTGPDLLFKWNNVLRANLDATASTAWLLNNSSGTLKTIWGVAEANGDLITGTLANDTVMRAQNASILFSVDSGTTAHVKIATTAMILGMPLTTKGYTVATLPTGVTGMLAHVTDALTPTFGATAVGGGAVKLPVFYNGTNWVTI